MSTENLTNHPQTRTGPDPYRPGPVPGKVHRNIARSAAVMGFATLVSRILGFIRDMVIARLFGVYLYAQAFVIAFRIPNLLRDVLAEGAANAALVPVFSEYAHTKSKEEFWELANVVLNVALVIGMLVTLVGILFSPLIVRLIAPGFSADPAKFAATVALNRIIFPYILLVSLAAYAMAILNTLGHFSVPAFAPCLLNISIIVCAMLFGEGIAGLASGVLIGGMLQVAIQIPVLYRKGFRLRLHAPFTHPALKTIALLMTPRVLSTCIYQLNNFVDSIFGSLAFIVGEGGVAILYFSYRLIQFPLGIVSASLSQAILPTLSRQAIDGQLDEMSATLGFGLRATWFVIVPAAVFSMVFAYPIVSVLFGGGKFDAYAATRTAQALMFYSVGLCAYAATKVVQSCFFALKDTATPMRVSALALLLNIVLVAVLMYPLKIAGIALATSLSGIISFVILFVLLMKKVPHLQVKGIIGSFVRIAAASIGMGAACVLAHRASIFANTYAHFAMLLAVGGASYFILCFVFRVSEMRQLLSLVIARFKRE